MIKINKKPIFQWLLFSMAFMAVFQLPASNVGFLKYALIAEFTEADIQQLQTEYKTVLKNKQPGDIHRWLNDETKKGGEITVIKKYKKNEQLCKRLKIKNQAKQKSATSYFNFCLIEKQWMLVN